MSGSPASIAPRAAQRRRPLVVVAEDGADARTMLACMLEFRGFDVVLTVDGRDALDAVLVHDPDAVVSDLNMPHLDGLELCRALRALPACNSLPVILWSSVEADEPRLLAALALGGVEFLSKSLAVARIDAALRHVVRTSEQLDGDLRGC